MMQSNPLLQSLTPDVSTAALLFKAFFYVSGASPFPELCCNFKNKTEVTGPKHRQKLK
jgi:hypothetical protein